MPTCWAPKKKREYFESYRREILQDWKNRAEVGALWTAQTLAPKRSDGAPPAWITYPACSCFGAEPLGTCKLVWKRCSPSWKWQLSPRHYCGFHASTATFIFPRRETYAPSVAPIPLFDFDNGLPIKPKRLVGGRSMHWNLSPLPFSLFKNGIRRERKKSKKLKRTVVVRRAYNCSEETHHTRSHSQVRMDKKHTHTYFIPIFLPNRRVCFLQ